MSKESVVKQANPKEELKAPNSNCKYIHCTFIHRGQNGLARMLIHATFLHFRCKKFSRYFSFNF